MAWRGLLAVAVLGAACNYRVAFEEYCTDTGFCQCTDGNCCVVEQFRCDQFECCDGLTCEGGICLSAAVLTAHPASVDFGKVNANAPARTNVVIENVGSAATPSAPELTVSEGFALEETDCDHVLAPGERCTVTVGCRADLIAPSVSGFLTVAYARRTFAVELTAQTGVEITIIQSPAAEVTDLTSERTCPTGLWCRWLAPIDTVLQLRVAPPAEGYSLLRDRWCAWTDGACAVTADESKTVTAEILPNLRVFVAGSGSVEGVSPACVRANDNDPTSTSCAYPVTGVVTLTATPIAPATRVRWSGACTGEGDCVLDVRGQTQVFADFL